MAGENWNLRGVKKFFRDAAKPALRQPGAAIRTHDEEIDIELQQTVENHLRCSCLSGGHDLRLNLYIMAGEVVSDSSNDVSAFRSVMSSIDIEKSNLLRLSEKRHGVVNRPR